LKKTQLKSEITYGDEIQTSLDEIFSLWLQMKSNPPTRRRGGFHPTKVGFHRAYDLSHPKGWI
jgi:hypothetical protein